MVGENSPKTEITRRELARRLFEVTHSVTNPQVQAEFRVVPPDLHVTPPIMEFVSDDTGERLIAIPSDSSVAKKHARMLERRVPVLSGMYRPEGLLLLNVPSGTRTVASYVHSIRRNPGAHAELFREMGTILSGVEKEFGHILVPSVDYPLLRQFAAVRSDETSSGGKIYLLPPYNLGSDNRVDTLNGIHQELVESRVVLQEQADFLVGQVSEGWAAS